MQISPQAHAVMVCYVCFLVIVTQIWGGRAKGEKSIERIRICMGIFMSILCVLYNAYYLRPAQFDWRTSLPLHACDILAVISALILLRPLFRIGRAVLYFSAISLATQAIITPTGNQDPSTFRFWLYWTLHAGIVACSLFDLTILRYKPNFRDLLMVVLVDLAYFSAIVPLNSYFGWNYGYLGNFTPEGSTIVDLLGPWPYRVPVLLGLVIIAQSSMLGFWIGYQKTLRFKRGRS